MKLSLVMPVYNEGRTLETVLKRLGEVQFPVPVELLLSDDESADFGLDAQRHLGEAFRRELRAARRGRTGYLLGHGLKLTPWVQGGRSSRARSPST